jgi:ribokinase
MPRVVCVGHVNWDVTLHVDAIPQPDGEARITNQRQSGGGSASNVACLLSGLDVDATVFGSIGRDDHGLLARRELEDLGVEPRLVEVADAETTVKYLVVDDSGEVMVLGNVGANEAFTADDVDPERIRLADHLHLTGQRPETASELARIASEGGVPVSFDPGRRIGNREFEATIERTDLLLVNDQEAATARERGYLDAVPEVVIKHGAEGAELVTGDERVSHAGYEVDPVDATGAGDAFAGGFLAARLQAADPAYALAVGNACGALTVRTPGARAYLSWADVEAMIDLEAESA